jgi:hypothetical protein
MNSKVRDIALRKAVVLWSAAPIDPPVVVIKIGERPPDPLYYLSWGACRSDFRDSSEADKVRMLFRHLDDLVSAGISRAAVHEAFLAIPEYRASKHGTHSQGTPETRSAPAADRH